MDLIERYLIRKCQSCLEKHNENITDLSEAKSLTLLRAGLRNGNL